MQQSRNKAEWRKATLEPALKRSPERQPRFETSSGLDLEPLYTPDNLDGFDYEQALGYPGEYPFTRGIQPSMYRGRLWTVRQYSGYASAEQSNKRYRYLLGQGQTGLSVAFDLPTQIGLDSDSPLAQGEVGKVGVPIDTIDDMEVLFQDIPLEKVSTSMTINGAAAPILGMYVAVAKKQGADISKLEGTTQNDVLKEYIARGTYIFPPRPSLRLTVDIFDYCSKNLPRWNTTSIGGYHIREAGSTAAQEIGFAFANAIAYVQAAIDAGLDVDAFAGRLSWIFQTNNNLFEEVAKLRAARRLWAKIMKERFGAKDARSWMFRTHVQTSGATLTAQQPYNNIVRATVQTLAAILGGVQSLATCSFDEALALPSEEAVQLSLRTQQILAYESGVADVVDPLGGSYLVENLTNQLETEITKYIEEIDKLGGAVSALEKGYQQREVQESSYRYQQAVEAGQHTIVGVNKFVTPTPKVPLMRVDASAARKQIARLNEFKSKRNKAEATAALKKLDKVAKSKENTMPTFIECAEAGATLGEMCDVLRNVFGTQRGESIF